MSGCQREVEGASIILLGSFNPTIVSPTWLAGNELIREEEADVASVKMIHDEYSAFEAAWLRIEVLRKKFRASTADPSQYLPLRDLVAGIFGILEHTPVTALGLNWDAHIRMPSEDKWHEFGHRVAPKKIWEPVLEPPPSLEEGTPTPEKPGTKSLVIQGRRSDSVADWNLIRVEPSTKIHPGVFLHINEHYGADNRDPNDSSQVTSNRKTKDFVQFVETKWSEFHQYAERVEDHLFKTKGAEGA